MTLDLGRNHRRIVAVFTGNRAEYGLLSPILRAVAGDEGLDYRLIVSGAHLDPAFGATVAEIRRDGFTVHAEAPLQGDAGGRTATAAAIAAGVSAVAAALDRLSPDMLVVYGDRFEAFAAAIAASQMAIPLAHVEGGDLTEGGALDDAVRHAISKLAHLHLATNPQSANRLLAMGEEPWRVHIIGFPPIDMIRRGDYADPATVAGQLDLDLSRPVVLFTQHSISTEPELAGAQIIPTLAALDRLATAEDCQIVATYPNNDAGGEQIAAALESWAAGRAGVRLRRSLGRYLYHGVLGLGCDPARRVICVGNSSSGIKETPAFGCPTVNIGARQQGRLRAANVIDAGYDATDIHQAARRCLTDPDFRAQCAAAVNDNPYGGGDAGPRAAAALTAALALPSQQLLRKGMTLRGECRDGWFR